MVRWPAFPWSLRTCLQDEASGRYEKSGSAWSFLFWVIPAGWVALGVVRWPDWWRSCIGPAHGYRYRYHFHFLTEYLVSGK